jgi:hypothetical protein
VAIPFGLLVGVTPLSHGEWYWGNTGHCCSPGETPWTHTHWITSCQHSLLQKGKHSSKLIPLFFDLCFLDLARASLYIKTKGGVWLEDTRWRSILVWCNFISVSLLWVFRVDVSTLPFVMRTIICSHFLCPYTWFLMTSWDSMLSKTLVGLISESVHICTDGGKCGGVLTSISSVSGWQEVRRSTALILQSSVRFGCWHRRLEDA